VLLASNNEDGNIMPMHESYTKLAGVANDAWGLFGVDKTSSHSRADSCKPLSSDFTVEALVLQCGLLWLQVDTLHP
jgi:hypothetical protein